MTDIDAPIPYIVVPPTAGQRRVLAAVWDHWAEHGTGPTRRELARRLGWSSPNALTAPLKALAAGRYVEWVSVEAGAAGAASRALWPAGLRDAIRATVRERMGRAAVPAAAAAGTAAPTEGRGRTPGVS